MSQRFDVGNVVTAMVTPFNKDLKIDFGAVEKLANHLVENGTDTVLVAGTTGESPTLSHDEEFELFNAVKNAVGTKAKIMLGTGSNSTQTAIEMTQRAEKEGADIVLSVVPYYNKPSQLGLIGHFSEIAKATDLPIMLYNIPGRTGINMSSDVIAKLANEHQNIVAVKQSNPDMDLVTEIIQKSPSDFAVYSGDDSLTLPMMSIGAKGVVSVVSHIAGNEMQKLVSSFKNNDMQTAQEMHFKVYNLVKAMFMTSNPCPLKETLSMQGIIEKFVRLPLVSLNETEKMCLTKVLDDYKKL